MQDVEEAYHENPYHNSTHAADVAQGLCALLAQDGFGAALTDLEMLAMVLACAIHDVGHPGAHARMPLASPAHLPTFAWPFCMLQRLPMDRL
jgi:beta-glucosidase-like glycosyl hydrolase